MVVYEKENSEILNKYMAVVFNPIAILSKARDYDFLRQCETNFMCDKSEFDLSNYYIRK